jgi:hypothetical protein
MTKRGWLTAGLALVTTCAVGVFVGRAMADGVPATGALTYTGVLEDATGAPLTGSKNIRISLFDALSGGTLQCQSASTPLQLVGGRFQLQLPDACANAVKAKPDQWVEVEVDGNALGRTKLGAVPYAVEAGRAVNATNATNAANATSATNATNATGALDTRIKALESQKQLNVFYKGGNNGTMTCDAFCEGAQWGQTGTCVGAMVASSGQFVSCGATPAKDMWCYCSRPSFQ